MNGSTFDTETTELIKNHLVKLDKQPHIVEFYAERVDFATGEVIEVIPPWFDGPRPNIIKPPIPIDDKDEKSTGKHHIYNSMVQTAPTFKEVAPQIRDFIERSPLMIAHNASFDVEMVDIEFERLGLTRIAWPRILCTVEVTRFMKGFNLKLGDLHELLFGAQHADAHMAAADVKALTRCCVELYKRDIL